MAFRTTSLPGSWCVCSVSCHTLLPDKVIKTSVLVHKLFSSWQKLCRAKHEIITSEMFLFGYLAFLKGITNEL